MFFAPQRVEVAVLEVARGGMIKRGLLPNYAVSCNGYQYFMIILDRAALKFDRFGGG